MTTATCSECGRANGPDARTCIWCGVPLISDGEPLDFEPLKAEVEYIEGFERLDGPAPVGLVVSPSGVEVREQMPGTRSIQIPIDLLVSASVTGPLRSVGTPPRRSASGWLRLKSTDESLTKRRSALTLKHRLDGEIQTVVFERNDEVGGEVLRRIARTIALLIRLGGAQADSK
jgi:hypothetical protein